MNRLQRRQAQHKHAHRVDRNAQVEPTAVLRPILMSRAFDPEESARISVDTRMAWHRLTHGAGGEPDFDLLANSANVALVAAEKLADKAGHTEDGALVVETVLRAQDALIGMRDRYTRTRRWGADASALAAVPLMLDFYDDLLCLSSPQTMVDALQESVRRMNLQRDQDAYWGKP